MQTVTFSSPFSRPLNFPPPIQNPPFPRAFPLALSRRRRRRGGPRPPTASFSAPRRRDCGSGDSVDEGMVVLRKRIREMRHAERGAEGGDDDDDDDALATSDWTEWERRYYEEQYLSDVCEFVGLVQTVLMGTRPSVAVGLIVMIGLSVPTALILIAARVAEASAPLISSAFMHGN